ncbi:hypothetical protein HCH_02076 [Hahella chejuensis KCTC 2396]|uniref:Uncharacterized protein n=1 Tax=Hahella chejuensis (strain KCTC 2396) TaxID=349521 RepID=Q2SKB7_HAHCH|nr:hypothetical protein [Hahella chejuensis]ABC28907.1 hypothetical protein HCH_02076 [Hahella chejuensis KCTC 2396]
MEPQAVNTLVDEAESLQESVSGQLKGCIPDELKHLFKDTSLFFQEEILAQWRIQERYDELIDYILYQHEEHGGEDFWKQVLLDLRLKKDEVRAFRMLEGLLPKRLDRVKVCSKNLKKYPDNYLSAANLGVAKGEALKVLYEYAYILENKPADQIDKAKVKKVKGQIEKVLSM